MSVGTESDRPSHGSVARLVDRLSKDLGQQHQVVPRSGGSMPTKIATVLYSYSPINSDELRLEVDDSIEVLESVEDGWMRGKLHGKVGVFPDNFVSFNTSVDALDQSIREEDIPIDHKDDIIDLHLVQREILPKKVKGIGFGNILGPTDSVQLRATRQTGGKSRVISDNKTTIEFVGRKPKETVLETSASSDQLKATTTTTTTTTTDVQLQQARVLFTYEPNHDDELALPEIGALVTVLSLECDDPGWCLGELDGQQGLFPDNFVQFVDSKKQSPPVVPSKPTKTGPDTISPTAVDVKKTTVAKCRENEKHDDCPPCPNSTESTIFHHKLEHPTVNRPKQSQKRPPSQVFLSQKQRISSDDDLDQPDCDSSKQSISDSVFASTPTTTSTFVSRDEFEALKNNLEFFKIYANSRIAVLERKL